MPRFSFVLSLLSLLVTVGHAVEPGKFHSPYKLTELYSGKNFLDGFDFDAIPDPTHGRVEYVNAEVAQAEGLVESSRDHFILRADATTVLSPSGPGRKSVRLISKNVYYNSVMVFDIKHMPQGCGTWPAVWSFGAPWPTLGELDILEGVNDQGPNHVTMHTSDGCDMPEDRTQTGTPVKNSCGIGWDNAGCPVKVNDHRSYGPAFNQEGGGWYAVERTHAYLKVWFWSRTAFDVPIDVRSGSATVDPSRWGTPTAYFPASESCDFEKFIGPHNILINLTFCGDWAGNPYVYGQSGCPSTCVDYVDNNPQAFKDAYFAFNALRIYKHRSHHHG